MILHIPLFVCMDETSKPQIKEVRQPIPVEPKEPERYDFE
jgi:hypothetical protein